MPQTQLPFFPEDIELINNHVGVQKKNGIVYYFNGAMPIFQHPENDYSSFRLFTSQLVVNGNATQMEIVRAFNVSVISVKRWVKKYRENGSGFFFIKKATPAPCTNPRSYLENTLLLRAKQQHRADMQFA